MNKRKTKLSTGILFIIELLVCYMSILAVVSYWRGPVQYETQTNEPVLKAAEFVSFTGEPTVGGFNFINVAAGNLVGYAAWLDLETVNPIGVRFMVDCPEENAGGILHIDLWNDGYDNDEQEYKLTLQAGMNEVNFVLDKGANAPQKAQLRFFTVDLANYSIQNLQISQAEPLPKVSSALLAWLFLCLILLIITAFALFRPRDSVADIALADVWGKSDKYEEAVVVKGFVKKLVQKLVGWYVEPAYQQNAFLRDELQKYQDKLTEYQLIQDEQSQKLDSCLIKIGQQNDSFEELQAQSVQQADCLNEYVDRLNEQKSLLNEYQQNFADLQKNITSWNELVQRMQERSEVDVKKAMIINDYINSNQAAMLYAYRYLLAREPDNRQSVINNIQDWYTLREEFMSSDEYKQKNSLVGATIPLSDVYTAQYNLAREIELKKINPDYELLLEKVYRKIIKVGDTVVDVGAHTGRHSKVFCNLIGELGKVYAFEPLPEQFNLLKSELICSNFLPINKALSDKKGIMDFYVVEKYPEESGLKQKTYLNDDAYCRKIQVEVDVLDDYFEEFSKLNYIKIDAEGAEISILNGATECLAKYRPIISVEYSKLSYSAFGLTKNSLWEFAKKNNYYITDIFGNVIFDVEIWNDVCDSVYWDYFLVPYEKIRDFLLNVHS